MISFSQQNRHLIIHTIKLQQHRRTIIYSRALSQSRQQHGPTTSSTTSSPPNTVDEYSKKLSRVHMKSESSIWDYAVNQFQKKPKPGR